jgi:hypothetical protein
MNELPVQIESLNCGNCGAPLKVPETAQFVTCNHCHSSLAIRRMHSITLTEKMEQTAQRLEEAETQLAELVYRNHVNEETRRWEREREQYMIKDKHGNRSVPNEAMGWVMLAVTTVMGMFVLGSGGGAFALIFIGAGVLGLLVTLNKSREYKAAYNRHRQRMRSIPRPGQNGSVSSPSTYLKQLESAPTPEDYLTELSRPNSDR